MATSPSSDWQVAGFPSAMGAIPWETKVVMPYWGTQAELLEVPALGASGRITSHVERFGLDEVDEVYRWMRDGTLQDAPW